MVNAAIGVAVNILLNIILGQLMGAPGLAFATSISSAIICGLLLFNLKNKFTGYSMKEAKTVLVKTVVATIGMISVLLIFEYLISISNPFLYLLCHLAVGAVTYLVLMYMLRTKEVLALLGMVMEYGKCINMKSMWR
jgi:putative peptidoglycan lipid II flippase